MSERARDENQADQRGTISDGGEYGAGQLVGGRYRIVSLIGRGGMGVVYKVEQIFLGKELALKTIDATSRSDIAIRRFQAEARAIFAVNHPNIVAVHDFGMLDDQTPFLAMEFVKGQTLADLIRAQVLSVDDTLKIFIQVCAGLAHAHKNGVVHRDVKPSNIMVIDGMSIDTEGSVKILDFGIAKLTQSDGENIQAMTKTGEIFGSPIYMSPEQCSGGQIDHRSDIYSLGCVLFEALTGTPPFVGESALSTMMMHQGGSTPTLKEASLGTNYDQALEQVVSAMLAKNPDDRYQDLSVTANDLIAIRKGQSENLSISRKNNAVISKKSAPTMSLKRSQVVAWMGSVAVISTIVTFLAMQLWFLSQDNAQKNTPSVHGEITAPPKLSPKAFKAELEKQAPDSHAVHVWFNRDIEENKNVFSGKVISDQDLSAFKDYKGAQILDVQDLGPHEVTNKGLSYLTNSKLLRLYMKGELQDIDNFSQLKYLNDLSISKSTLNKKAISDIVNLKMLATLNLNRINNITEDQIRQLTRSNSLTTLVLTKDTYSPAFIKELHEKMPQCFLQNYDAEPPLKVSALPNPKDRYASTLSKLQKIKTRNPRSAGVATCLHQLAQIQIEQKQFAEANKLLDEAIKLLDKNGNEDALPPLLKDAAAVAAKNNEPSAATRHSDRFVELAPATMFHNEPEIYDSIEEVVQYPKQLRQWQKVVNYCNVAIELFEKFPDAVKTSKKMRFYTDAGDCNVLLKNKEEALEDFRKLEPLTDSNPERDIYWHASAFVRMGRCLPTDAEQKASYIKGMQMIEQAGMPDTFNLLEHYCDACVNTGKLLLKEGKTKEALAYNKKGLAVVEQRMKDPKHMDAYARRQAFAYDIASMLRELGRMDEVRSMEQKYNIKLEPKATS
ncbi:MAG: serine/threonine-protein kinase [Candidatus Obscuribacterales bacterium]